jgi:hypothetical protein
MTHTRSNENDQNIGCENYEMATHPQVDGGVECTPFKDQIYYPVHLSPTECKTTHPICADIRIHKFSTRTVRGISPPSKTPVLRQRLNYFSLDTLLSLHRTAINEKEIFSGYPFIVSGLVLKRGWHNKDNPEQPNVFRFQKILPLGYQRECPYCPFKKTLAVENLETVNCDNFAIHGQSPLWYDDHHYLGDIGFYNPFRPISNPQSASKIMQDALTLTSKTPYGGAHLSNTDEPDYQITIWVDPVNQYLNRFTGLSEFMVEGGTSTYSYSRNHFGDNISKLFQLSNTLDFTSGSGYRDYGGYGSHPSKSWDGEPTTVNSMRSAVPGNGTLTLHEPDYVGVVGRKSKSSSTKYGSNQKNSNFVENYINTYASTSTTGISSFDAFVWRGQGSWSMDG